ncbi:yfiH [Candidatus Sodalis pierantonius str. SOPE]|uniref:Purine nucleoside phosphorylase n=1 Tax=Candidatus Sodalis pierantonii str. SOPE TaxID=2342 RepID=W0HMA9_9GAMM|nr:purine nucleoside phosphorylase YfiH [Candidatus Sodalis pierantonius]AHF73243.1 yfiH [Candidatus Sodalis pierantonius str. SOPE]
MSRLILPDWPAPSQVGACSTTREGGVSQAPWHSLNLGDHVGDDPDAVAENRPRLRALAHLPAAPHYLTQVHGVDVVVLEDAAPTSLRGDAVYTRRPGEVCVVMTADCLPVLFCDRGGREVAAAHAGWRGLCAGVLEQTLAAFQAPRADILAWRGPAIGPTAFEVGAEVKDAFTRHDPAAAGAFVPRGEKYLADLYQLARLRLRTAGIRAIYGGKHCTVQENNTFFSYRRDGVTGRMATLVWLI